MMLRFAALAALATLRIGPAWGVDGEILLTQAKALAGNVTPGDAAGYPITISAAGSYKLAGNLDVPAGANGIVVTAAGVDIDLAGFRLFGGANGIYGSVDGV